MSRNVKELQEIRYDEEFGVVPRQVPQQALHQDRQVGGPWTAGCKRPAEYRCIEHILPPDRLFASTCSLAYVQGGRE